MKFGKDVQHMRQMSLLTFERSRSKFKVKTAIMKIFHLLGCGSDVFTKFGNLTEVLYGTICDSLPDELRDQACRRVWA